MNGAQSFPGSEIVDAHFTRIHFSLQRPLEELCAKRQQGRDGWA